MSRSPILAPVQRVGLALGLAVLVSSCGPTTTSAGLSASPAAAAQATTTRSSASPTATNAICVGRDPKANVYHPDRLVLINACKTVSGTVVSLRREADGDWHIGLRLDSGQEALLNAKNLGEQGGNLVLEIICANTVTQADAISACATYQNTIPPPIVGAHISAVGPYVLDSTHGWNEIHPVWEITVLASATTTTAPARTTTVSSSATPAQVTGPTTPPVPSGLSTPSPLVTAPIVVASPVLVPTVAATATPAPVSSAPSPTSALTAPTPAPTAAPTTLYSNPWAYNFICCTQILSPPANFCDYFACIASFWNGVGYVIQCQDLTFSKSGGRSGSCSQHGGNYRALLAP